MYGFTLEVSKKHKVEIKDIEIRESDIFDLIDEISCNLYIDEQKIMYIADHSLLMEGNGDDYEISICGSIYSQEDYLKEILNKKNIKINAEKIIDNIYEKFKLIVKADY